MSTDDIEQQKPKSRKYWIGLAIFISLMTWIAFNYDTIFP